MYMLPSDVNQGMPVYVDEMMCGKNHKIVPFQNLLLLVLSQAHHPCPMSSQHAPAAMYHLTTLLWKILL
jgi:hypothetical protein